MKKLLKKWKGSLEIIQRTLANKLRYTANTKDIHFNYNKTILIKNIVNIYKIYYKEKYNNYKYPNLHKYKAYVKNINQIKLVLKGKILIEISKMGVCIILWRNWKLNQGVIIISKYKIVVMNMLVYVQMKKRLNYRKL